MQTFGVFCSVPIFGFDRTQSTWSNLSSLPLNLIELCPVSSDLHRSAPCFVWAPFVLSVSLGSSIPHWCSQYLTQSFSLFLSRCLCLCPFVCLAVGVSLFLYLFLSCFLSLSLSLCLSLSPSLSVSLPLLSPFLPPLSLSLS